MELVKPSHEIMTQVDGREILKTIESAGRVCYKSEDLITDESCVKFVAGITKRGHHSVIEHYNVTVRFICDRGVTHELVRHRLAAYSQESTRYCNYSGGVAFIIPPWVNLEPGTYNKGDNQGLNLSDGDTAWFNAMIKAEEQYIRLTKLGWNAQQARSVLPNSLKTEIVMTANMREWLHVFNLRCAAGKAHPQIIEVMLPVLKAFHDEIPEIYSGVFEKHYPQD